MGCKCQKAGFNYDAYNAARPGTRPAPGTPGGPRGPQTAGRPAPGTVPKPGTPGGPRGPQTAGRPAPGTVPKPGTPGGPRGDLRCGNALAGYSRPQRPHIPGFENAPGMRPHRPDLA